MEPPLKEPITSRCPRILVGATHSGCGKTSITLGLIAACRKRGLKVQAFKVGPDFLDPTYLSVASGRPCYNLDGWMTNRDYIRELFVKTTQDADLAVIEGVMGLFDGASSNSIQGSSAEVASWLGAKVLLVANTHGLSGTLAPLVKGFVGFAPDVEIAGVIANHCGSKAHAGMLDEALKTAGLLPLIGAVKRGSIPHLASRHLGLLTANPESLKADHLDQLAQIIGKSVDLTSVLRHAKDTPAIVADSTSPQPYSRSVRIGIARDDAFHFYYQDNLDALERAGATLCAFSPLVDKNLPPDLDAVYLGGGYPEEYATVLAENLPMREALRAFAFSGGTIYAECGGLVYLTNQIETLDGRTHSLVGLIPVGSKMSSTLIRLSYTEVTLRKQTLWGQAGAKLRGHEYHYSTLDANPLDQPEWQGNYHIETRNQAEPRLEGFQNQNLLASYIHLHWASCPTAADRFIRHCHNDKG